MEEFAYKIRVNKGVIAIFLYKSDRDIAFGAFEEFHSDYEFEKINPIEAAESG